MNPFQGCFGEAFICEETGFNTLLKVGTLLAINSVGEEFDYPSINCGDTSRPSSWFVKLKDELPEVIIDFTLKGIDYLFNNWNHFLSPPFKSVLVQAFDLV